MKTIPIAEPDWLDGGLDSMERCIRLARSGRLPKKILGWMLVTSCLRVLRSVYGSDELTIQGLKLHVHEREQSEAMYACSPGVDH